MENIVDTSLAQKSGNTAERKHQEVQIVKLEETAPSLKGVTAKPGKQDSDKGVPCRAPAMAVLAERNTENNHPIAGSTNKMVSPVLLKLRRNQEKRITQANPVNPVQVPTKHFQGFPVERYMSPTDSIMSPISRGLLARNRRLKRPPPASVLPKVLDNTFQDAEELVNAGSK